MTLAQLAAAVHDVNRQIQIENGEPPNPKWADLPADSYLVTSTYESIQQILDDPNVDLEEQHNRWLKERLGQGWTLGPVKDATRKINPALKPYAELSPLDRLKDRTRVAIVLALRPALESASGGAGTSS